MAQKILPHEAWTMEHGAIIKTRCPQADVTEEMIILRAKNLNLELGDTMIVQCVDHAMTEVQAEAEYRVITRKSRLQTVELNDRETRQSEVVTYGVRLVGEWWVAEEASVEEEVKRGPGRPKKAA